jgi:hypothetical protein
MGGRWPKQARHTSQMDQLRMRGEELAVEAPARPSGRDGVMALPHLHRGGSGVVLQNSAALSSGFKHKFAIISTLRMVLK